MRSAETRLATFAFVLAIAWAAPARASNGYSDDLARDLSLASTPPCAVCHAPSDASIGPADTPFAVSMKARGLRGNDDASSLATAIAAMQRDDVDSDGDGATDLDELSWGGDPNVADGPSAASAASVEPQYGCAVTRTAGSRGSAWVVVAAFALVRRRSRPKR